MEEPECGLGELYGATPVALPQTIKGPQWSWEFLQSRSYGEAVWDTMLADHEPVVVFMARETQADIAALPQPAPAIWKLTSLGTRIGGRKVMPIVVLINFFPFNTIYEVWFNFYGEGAKETQEAFLILAKQPLLLLFFYDRGPEPLRKLGFENELSFFFSGQYKMLKALPPWTDDDFNEAKRRLMDTYTTDDLWSMK